MPLWWMRCHGVPYKVLHKVPLLELAVNSQSISPWQFSCAAALHVCISSRYLDCRFAAMPTTFFASLRRERA
jgi:hypothetical protein